MAVKVGSARIDEHGNIRGGAAGDQLGGREVSTQNWYLHNKGWIVIRPIDSAVAEKIARCMQMACDSKYIGYDQGQRNTLYDTVKNYGFDISKLNKNVETDCSALVRVCCAYAGIMVADFNTASEVARLEATGKFKILRSALYTQSSSYLKRGDILVTASRGHTVIVLSNGERAINTVKKTYTGTFPNLINHKDGLQYLEQGDTGKQVTRLQQFLNWYGDYGLNTDGVFGAKTTAAVKKFQKANGLEVDGIFGVKSLAKAKTIKK